MAILIQIFARDFPEIADPKVVERSKFWASKLSAFKFRNGPSCGPEVAGPQIAESKLRTPKLRMPKNGV